MKSESPPHWLAPTLFFLILGLHLAIVLTSQRHVDGDEGVVGIMAQHIIERGSQPLFFYGQDYGAGASLEAYLAVPFITLFGQSSLAFKLTTILISALTLLTAYHLLKRSASPTVALMGMSLLGLATPLIEWRTKLRGGYVALPLFMLLTLLCYERIVTQKRRRMVDYFLLGLVAGVGFYNSALGISLLIALAVASLFQAKRFWHWHVVAVLPGFALGASRLLLYDLRNDFAHTRYLLRVDSAENTLADLPFVLTNRLPRFFVGRNVDLYLDTVPINAWLEYTLYAAFCLLALALSLSSFYRHQQRKKATDDAPNFILHPSSFILLLFLTIHIALFTTSGDRDLSPRYLLPLIPALVLLVALTVGHLMTMGKRWRWIGQLALGALLLSGLVNHLRYLRAPTVTDDVLVEGWQIQNRQTRGDLAQRLNSLLRENGVTHARASYFLQWRMLFEGAESVIVSSEGFFPTVSRFGEYDARVNSADKVAIILHQESLHLQDFLATGFANGMQRQTIDEYVVFLP